MTLADHTIWYLDLPTWGMMPLGTFAQSTAATPAVGNSDFLVRNSTPQSLHHKYSHRLHITTYRRTLIRCYFFLKAPQVHLPLWRQSFTKEHRRFKFPHHTGYLHPVSIWSLTQRQFPSSLQQIKVKITSHLHCHSDVWGNIQVKN